MRILRVFCLSLLWLASFQAVLQCQNLFDSLSMVKYANFLYQAGSYGEAAEEYERLVGRFSADNVAKYRLVSSYRKRGLTAIALDRMDELWISPHSVSQPVAREFFALKIVNDSPDNLLHEIDLNSLLTYRDKMFLSSAHLLFNDRYNEAHHLLSGNMNYPSPVLSSFMSLANEGIDLTWKSPVLSGSLSAVIPGAGKFYIGKWQDGLLALVSVGTMAWQSYRGFDNNGVRSSYGWVFGTIGTVFYIGNIAGSIKAANRFNKVNRERIRDHVQEIFTDNI